MENMPLGTSIQIRALFRVPREASWTACFTVLKSWLWIHLCHSVSLPIVLCWRDLLEAFSGGLFARAWSPFYSSPGSPNGAEPFTRVLCCCIPRNWPLSCLQGPLSLFLSPFFFVQIDRWRKLRPIRPKDKPTWGLPGNVRGPDYASPMRDNHVMLPEGLPTGTVRGPDHV